MQKADEIELKLESGIPPEEQARPVRACAWCERYLNADDSPGAPYPRSIQREDARRGAVLSHGVCRECLKTMQ